MFYNTHEGLQRLPSLQLQAHCPQAMVTSEVEKEKGTDPMRDPGTNLPERLWSHSMEFAIPPPHEL